MQGAQQRHHRHHLHAQGTSSEIQRKHGGDRSTKHKRGPHEMEEDSQVRYEDENSMNSAGVPVERGSDQTLNAEEGTGRPVTESTGRPVTRRLKSSTTEFGLKATRQWNAGCRELTLPRNDGSSTPKGWIRGSTKICSVGRNKFVKDLTEKARTLGINDENDSEATGRLVQQENENRKTFSNKGRQTCSESEA